MSNPRPEATLGDVRAEVDSGDPRVLILDLSVDPALYRPLEHWGALLGQVSWRSVRVNAPRGGPVPVRRAVPGLDAGRPAGMGLDAGRPAGMGVDGVMGVDAGRPAGMGVDGVMGVEVAEGMEDMDGVEGFTHLIVTGSEASIVEPQAWFEPAEALVRRAVEAGRPVLGSCFGHQLVVRALLGPSHVRRAARPELGWFPLEITAGGSPFKDLPRDPWMFSCHFDEVCDLPHPWEVCARSAGCEVHFYRHTERPIWGIQAHPEIGPEAGAELLRGFEAQRPELRPLVAQALASPAPDDGFGATLIERFLEGSL